MKNLHIENSYNIWKTTTMDGFIIFQCFKKGVDDGLFSHFTDGNFTVQFHNLF